MSLNIKVPFPYKKSDEFLKKIRNSPRRNRRININIFKEGVFHFVIVNKMRNSKMNKILVFDYENTLSEHGGKISNEMAKILSDKISRGFKVSIISSKTMHWWEMNNMNLLEMIFQSPSKLSNSEIKKIKENLILYTGEGSEKFLPKFSKKSFSFNEEISYRKCLTPEEIFKIQEIIKTKLPTSALSGKNYTKHFFSRDHKGVLKVIIKFGEIQHSLTNKILSNIKSKLNKTKKFSKILLEIKGDYISFSFKNKSFAIKDLFKNNPEYIIEYYSGSPLKDDKTLLNPIKRNTDNKLNFVHTENPIHTLSLMKTHQNYSLNDSKNILDILSIKEVKENVEERLKKYWRSINLPFSWISSILSILEKNRNNEHLAILKVRNKFPSLEDKNSLDYSKKLDRFRKRKIRNLSKRINKFIVKGSIADIGGRTDDFMEEILKLNKSIKKSYVTDIGAFSQRSKNPKINFIVQPSLVKTPFYENSLNNIILSLTLHHMNNLDQKLFIKHLSSILKKKGRLILIEEGYPEKYANKDISMNIKKFLSFEKNIKMKIISFYDWFGNKIMRNRDNIALTFNYKTMEEWKTTFEREGLSLIYSEFIGKKPAKLDLFPPKVVMVFEKTGESKP